MKISVTLPAGPEGAGVARKALDELVRETPTDVLSTVELLVSELVVNTPVHKDQEAEQVVLVHVETTSTTIHAEVTDVAAGEVERATPEQDLRSGWNVVLLEELSSRWGIMPGSHNGVWFEIDRWTRASLGNPR